MDIPSPQNKERFDNKESLSDIKKKLDTGQAIQKDPIKEIQSRSLSRSRDILNATGGSTIINVKQGEGTININTGKVENTKQKREISSDFFSKQTGFSSSNVPFKGGRL